MIHAIVFFDVFQVIRDILGSSQGPSSSTPVQSESESIIDERGSDLQAAKRCMEDSFDLPNDVLESSLTSASNDYLQTDVTDISVEGQSPQVSCEMCKKMKKKIITLQRKKWKLERDLKCREQQIENFESKKKLLEDRQKVLKSDIKFVYRGQFSCKK